MCGIVAIFNNEREVEEESLRDAVDALIPRGPDEQSTWFSNNRRVALGHARLSIIDLTTGIQPIASEDGKLHIIHNGEFYDYERITRELESRGHKFRTKSDSEIALHLYKEMGAACLEHLRGEFAFVIWDEENETLFAARDRFGIKPLFYVETPDGLRIASEAKALFASGLEAAWDHESVFQNLFFSFDQDRTLFKNVRQLPPGHYLIARKGVVTIHKYWDVDYPKADAIHSHLSEPECIENVRSMLDEAIRLRMRADVPVGCYLSGGVDSSAVLGMARKYSAGKFTAFTIAFDHPDFDESGPARRMAEFAGAEFRPIPVKGGDFADVFYDAVWKGEMIHYNAHGAARYHLSRAVRSEGYKVVIGGEGADELFAGYDFSSQALLAGSSGGIGKWLKMFGRLLRPKTDTERRIAATSPWLAGLGKTLAFPPHLTDYVADKFTFLHSIIAPEFAMQFAKRDPYREFFRQFDYRKTLYRKEPAKQILYLWMKSLFVNYVLAAERLDMANAVEVRLPFLDHKLFEYGRSIPGSMLAKDGTIKYILREAAREYITDEVYRGLKQPFLAPPTTKRNDDHMFVMLQDILRSDGFAGVPFFDRTAVIKMLDDMCNMDDAARAAMDPILYMMASIGVLHEKYRL
jgi:asparagine synthase (glutamine-hydrolysing)